MSTCDAGATWPAGKLAQATHSSPPLTYRVRDTGAGTATPALTGKTVGGAQGACVRAAAGLAGPGCQQQAKIKQSLTGPMNLGAARSHRQVAAQ